MTLPAYYDDVVEAHNAAFETGQTLMIMELAMTGESAGFFAMRPYADALAGMVCDLREKVERGHKAADRALNAMNGDRV